jgi:hypothetical protein
MADAGTYKMQQATSSLDRRLGQSWEQAQLSGARRRPLCKVRLDRLVVTASEADGSLILGIPGVRRGRNHFLRRKHPTDFLPYGRRTPYLTNGSISQVVVLSEPSMQHIAPCKVTLIARDELGLQPQDVLSVLELLPDMRFVLVELAFDFGFHSEVDGANVRAHALFGKSRPNQVAVRRGWDCWGTRRGAKFVRSYFKPQLGAHRVELQLNRKFLRRHEIKDIFDFKRLVEIVPERHILFAEIDKSTVVRHLKNAGHDRYEVRQILERVSEHDDDIYAQCAVLRKRGRLKNVRRALVPLHTNYLVQKAIKKWAEQWPKKPGRLEGKR